MEDQFFFYRDGGVLKQLFLNDIVYMIAEGNHTEFYTHESKLLIRVSMNDALRLLPDKQFVRINRSVAVAFRYINRIKGDSVFLHTYDKPLVHTNGKPLGVTFSTQHYKAFLKQIVILQTSSKKRKEVAEDQ